MQVYTLEVRDRELSLRSDDSTLVRTSTLADRLEILFYSDEWLDEFELSVALARGEEIAEIPITLELAPEESEDDTGDDSGDSGTSDDSGDSGESGDSGDDSEDEETDWFPDEGAGDWEYDIDELETETDEWLAKATVDVPSTILEATGDLAVTVHGSMSTGEYIVTALSIPLEIREEGESGGDAPDDSPYIEGGE